MNPRHLVSDEILAAKIRARMEIYTMPEPMSGCHLWIGAVNRKRYGQIRINGRTLEAHRVAWVLAGHELPDGAFLLHRCDNPPCVNVKHLFIGDHQMNAIDKARKDRGVRSKCGLPFGARIQSNGRYTARVTHLAKRVSLGTFDTPEEASLVARHYKAKVLATAALPELPK